MKMMERKAYTALGETGFGETGRHPFELTVTMNGRNSETSASLGGF